MSGTTVPTTKPFVVVIPTSFIIGTGLVCVLISFCIGTLCHTILFEKVLTASNLVLIHDQHHHHGAGGTTPTIGTTVGNDEEDQNHLIGLPRMFYAANKVAPKTIYSSKTYQTDVKSTSANTVLVEKRLSEDGSTAVDSKAHDNKNDNEHDEDDHAEDEIHEPAGQHLLVDFENIDSTFLNSETRIAQAMVDIVTISGLTMLSYHCHALTPKGISCVGVLLESHISVHTWPSEGVLLLDLFTCGPKPLLPLLPLIQSFFGITSSPPKPNSKPNMIWAHKRRGFKTERQEIGVQGFDLDHYAIGWLEFDYKHIVSSVETPYQSIDIIDIINPRFVHWEQYEKSLSSTEQTYESKHKHLFRPDRFVFMNGVVQSRRYGEVAYHEALVHPALSSSIEIPKRVAIIGGGEGATLREVLKYNTIETVVMVEIDEVMVNVSKEHLSEWNTCHHLTNRTKSCFDDPRVQLHCTDAGAWFVDRYLDPTKINDDDKFDVVIMDSLDPQDMVDFADALFSSESFLKSIYNSLTSTGIFVSQIGEHDFEESFPDSMLPERRFKQSVANVGYETVRTYPEAHGGFFGVWHYMIAFKTAETKMNWFANEAEIDLKLHVQSVETIATNIDNDDKATFRFFDGATQQIYQYPSRITENVFCRNIPTPPLCSNGHGYDPYIANVHIDTLEVRESTVEGAGRGVFFKQAYPAGTYVCIDEGSFNVVFYPSTTLLIQEFLKRDYTSQWKLFDYYMFGYGFANDYYGEVGFSVDPSIMTFINHGCNGTYNMGFVTNETEITASVDSMISALDESYVETVNYNPYVDRNHMIHMNGLDTLLRDVNVGDELLDNYLSYLHEDNWESGLLDYRSQCINHAKGAITEYETEEVIGSSTTTATSRTEGTSASGSRSIGTNRSDTVKGEL